MHRDLSQETWPPKHLGQSPPGSQAGRGGPQGHLTRGTPGRVAPKGATRGRPPRTG